MTEKNVTSKNLDTLLQATTQKKHQTNVMSKA